ncbi:MAG: tRNA (N6-isopentenyl adenosine(37)-C2)-methylthiotransferase MiaB [bacterium]
MNGNGKPAFFIKTFGCQMNRCDADLLARFFSAGGLAPADSPENSDLVHVHTCCVRQKAEDKFFSLLGGIRRLKTKKPSLIVGVGGCIPEKRDLAGDFPFLDYVIGAGEISRYADTLNEALHRLAPHGFNVEPRTPSPVSRFIAVLRGCSNPCSYCVVPSVRGPEKSRTPEEVEAEAREMARAGCREITILGQNVLAYGEDLAPRRTLLDVIAALHDLPGIERLRFITSHPRWVTESFLRELKNFPKVCEHFHVPCQSGDDEILRLMNRGYSSRDYERVVSAIREHFPPSSITADVIVGFPGETDRRFRNTLALIQSVSPDSVYSFKYSPRPGTPAAALADSVPAGVKNERLRLLNELQNAISRRINDSLVGASLDVLVEETVDPAARRYRGRTRTNKIADFRAAAPLEPGEIATVRVLRATPHALIGETP